MKVLPSLDNLRYHISLINIQGNYLFHNFKSSAFHRIITFFKKFICILYQEDLADVLGIFNEITYTINGSFIHNKSSKTESAFIFLIWMSHCRHQATEGTEFWISCKLPAFLSNFSPLQLIQNSVPSFTRQRQCDIQISLIRLMLFSNFPPMKHNIH